MRKESFVSPIERYLQSGDTPLSAQKLVSIHDSLSDSAKITNMMASADVCLDIASQVDLPDEWLERSRDHLETLIDDYDYLLNSGNNRSFYRDAQTYARAKIRLSEIDNWTLAVNGELPNDNYKNLLQTGLELLPHIDESNTSVVSMVIEYVPLLLGARARHIDNRGGWLGRMALLREDCRLIIQKGRNLNWDLGICNDEGTDYISPENKLQISAKRKQGSQRYEAAGIKTIIARKFGFLDVTGVINGCAQELLPIDEVDVDSIAMTSEELDFITDRLAGSVINR